jgi:hypothetical protein
MDFLRQPIPPKRAGICNPDPNVFTMFELNAYRANSRSFFGTNALHAALYIEFWRMDPLLKTMLA